MAEVPGWYKDALEQGLGQIVSACREGDLPVELLAETFLDQRTGPDGRELTDVQHRETMALCLGILVRRLALVDVL